MPLIVDAGIGLPSHAAAAMELGYDAVLLNTAVAQGGRSGRDGARRSARRSKRAAPRVAPVRWSRATLAAPSTPVLGKAHLS